MGRMCFRTKTRPRSILDLGEAKREATARIVLIAHSFKRKWGHTLLLLESSVALFVVREGGGRGIAVGSCGRFREPSSRAVSANIASWSAVMSAAMGDAKTLLLLSLPPGRVNRMEGNPCPLLSGVAGAELTPLPAKRAGQHSEFNV